MTKPTTKAMATKKKGKENGKKAEKGSEDSSCSSSPVLIDQVAGDEGVVSSSCRFPMSRVRRLMEGSDRGKKSGIRPTHEAVFVINKATEMFLEQLAEDGYKFAKKECKKTISYKYMSSNVYTNKRLEFLLDFVPEKLKAGNALDALTSLEQPQSPASCD